MSDLTPDAEKSRTSKIALRNRLLTQRRARSTNFLASAASQLQDQLLSLVRREAPTVIAAYAPVGSEPGGALLPDLLAEHARVLLPVLLPDGDLDWAVHSGSMEAGPRGLREPAGPRMGVFAISDADLVLVPALAVDRSGLRMGRGGGSYDRALARVDAGRTRVLALLHEGELVDAVPAEPHDMPVHGAVLPRGVISLPLPGSAGPRSGRNDLR